MGFKQILFDGGQIGVEADFLVLDAQLRPDVVAVEIDSAFRQVHRLCDLLGGFALLNKIDNRKLRRRKPQQFGRQVARER